MSAHEGHDHPATKAARAACRRGRPTSDERYADQAHGEPTKKRRPKEKAGERLQRATQLSEEASRGLVETREGNPECIHDHVRRVYITIPAGSRATRFVCEEPGCDAVKADAFGGWAPTASLHAEAKGKAKAASIDPALPHEFDPAIDKPTRCYWCKKAKSSRVHSDGPTDLAARFGF